MRPKGKGKAATTLPAPLGARKPEAAGPRSSKAASRGAPTRFPATAGIGMGSGEFALALAHDLNNIIGALALRAAVLSSDPVCRRAQGPNLDSMERLLEEGRDLVSSLERLGQLGPMTRSRWTWAVRRGRSSSTS